MSYKNLLVALFLTVPAQVAYSSEDIYVNCETCFSDYEFSNSARTKAKLNSTVTVHVMNFNDVAYKKFQITKTKSVVCEQNSEPDGRGGSLQICRDIYKHNTLTLALNNQELSDFTDYALAYNDAKSLFSQRAIEVPKILTPTAFDLVQNSYTQGKVAYYFNNNAPLSATYKEKFVTVVGSASKVVKGGTTLIAPPLVFSFDDGTLAYAILDFVDSDDQYHFKFIKIADGHNSLDLTQSNPFTGSYTFINMSSNSWKSFFNAMTSLGLTIRGASESIIPTGTVTIVPICNTGKVCPSPN